jgi:hypothetical protein
MDARLQRRYWQLVREHMTSPQELAAGPKAALNTCQSFASTQALWRFLANPRVTLPQLVVAPRVSACRAVAESESPYILLVHDWSKLSYLNHSSKKDQAQVSHKNDIGYELYTALLVDAGNGAPLAPMELELRCSEGVHTTRGDRPAKPVPHLDQILPTMLAARNWGLQRRVVHVIDREADSQADFRMWSAKGELFLVRADFTRKVEWEEQSFKMPDLVKQWADDGRFKKNGTVDIRGKTGVRYIAEGKIVLNTPARKRTSMGRIKLPRGSLNLRLVVSRIIDEKGEVLAEWYLLTNVPDDVSALQIADWYYWRWKIESYHKLLKSGGQQLESWQQETAEAIAKRLLIAAMVCVCAWQLERQTTPEAVECQKLLVRLSGRQMKRKRPITTPALIAGIHILLPILELLEQYTPAELRRFAKCAVPQLLNTG